MKVFHLIVVVCVLRQHMTCGRFGPVVRAVAKNLPKGASKVTPVVSATKQLSWGAFKTWVRQLGKGAGDLTGDIMPLLDDMGDVVVDDNLRELMTKALQRGVNGEEMATPEFWKLLSQTLKEKRVISALDDIGDMVVTYADEFEPDELYKFQQLFEDSVDRAQHVVRDLGVDVSTNLVQHEQKTLLTIFRALPKAGGKMLDKIKDLWQKAVLDSNPMGRDVSVDFESFTKAVKEVEIKKSTLDDVLANPLSTGDEIEEATEDFIYALRDTDQVVTDAARRNSEKLMDAMDAPRAQRFRPTAPVDDVLPPPPPPMPAHFASSIDEQIEAADQSVALATRGLTPPPQEVIRVAPAYDLVEEAGNQLARERLKTAGKYTAVSGGSAFAGGGIGALANGGGSTPTEGSESPEKKKEKKKDKQLMDLIQEKGEEWVKKHLPKGSNDDEDDYNNNEDEDVDDFARWNKYKQEQKRKKTPLPEFLDRDYGFSNTAKFVDEVDEDLDRDYGFKADFSMSGNNRGDLTQEDHLVNSDFPQEENIIGGDINNNSSKVIII